MEALETILGYVPIVRPPNFSFNKNPQEDKDLYHRIMIAMSSIDEIMKSINYNHVKTVQRIQNVKIILVNISDLLGYKQTSVSPSSSLWSDIRESIKKIRSRELKAKMDEIFSELLK